MRVLITRPQPEAGRTAAALAACGHVSLLTPLTEVVALHPVIEPGDAQGLIATSARAFLGLDPLSPGLATLPLHAVGARTAEAGMALGLRLAAEPAPDAAALAERLEAVPPTRLLYLAGHDRKPALESRLAGAGHRVRTLETYAAQAVSILPEPARAALADGQLDAVLHHSRRHAELFDTLVTEAGLAGPAARLRHVCLSADVAAALAPLTQNVRIAATPDEAALLAALEAP